jgi:flavin-dependent dehydrogenase
MVASAVEAEDVRFHDIDGGGFYSYWADVECLRAELFTHTEGFTVAFPTNDDLVTVAMAFPEPRFGMMRKDPEVEVLAWLDELGSIGERVRAGRRVHPLIPIANVVNQLRHSWGPGWVLVGDAAYVKDPSPADGITDAWRGADFAAEALSDVLSDRSTEEEGLGGYQTRLVDSALPLLEKTLVMSDFDITAVERATAFFEIQALHGEEVAAMQSQTGVAS